jgi:hypothetical protein
LEEVGKKIGRRRLKIITHDVEWEISSALGNLVNYWSQISRLEAINAQRLT